MSNGVSAGAVLEHARGDVNELAAAVVASFTSDVSPLPRSLYTNDSEAA
jgi:hypothetical protein